MEIHSSAAFFQKYSTADGSIIDPIHDD